MTTPCVYTIQHSIFWCVVAGHFLICLVGNCPTNSVTSGRKFLDVVRRNFIQILASTLLSWGWAPSRCYISSFFVRILRSRSSSGPRIVGRSAQPRSHDNKISAYIAGESIAIDIPLAWNKHKAARLLDPTTVLGKLALCLYRESA